MNESKIFCSVIIFTLGVYTIFLLQYELYKLNSLTSANRESGGGHSNPSGAVKRERNLNENSLSPDSERICHLAIAKRKINIDKLNCGSASEIVSIDIQDCKELPCDIKPNANYSISLSFKPSRNLSKLEIDTFVTQRKELKSLHKEQISLQAAENDLTTLKLSFTFPPPPFLKHNLKIRKCPPARQLLYLLGIEIWDVPSGIGEICLVTPIFLVL